MTGKASPSYARVVVEPVNERFAVASAAVSFCRAAEPAVLESSLQNGPYGRYTILACDPVEVFEFDRHEPGCPFRALARRAAAYPAVAADSDGIPFVGGWIGFITYEAGLTIEGIERTTVCDVPIPALRFGLYDAAAIYDHLSHQWHLVAVDWPTGTVSRAPVRQRLRALHDRLAATGRLTFNDHAPPPHGEMPTPNMSYQTYLAGVARAKRYIEAGDIYQVNLTQRFTTRTDAPPWTLYRRLCRANPAPHAAFLLSGDVAILSSSPELFLDLRDGHVVTRPIKGTRPRVGEREADKAYRRELEVSAKDRAELNMIIDLLRNDLGRVCSFGSVRVAGADEIEAHPTVFHRVATIEGDLRPDCAWVDLLRATFPGGSVTGAPKIRAMQIIDELEPTTRGVYCGSVGWIGLDGSMSLNIAIRTMVQVRDVVHFYAGGAIVADSHPEEEYKEIMAKAEGMARALGCGTPSEENVPVSVTEP
jgi:para-aminobenzoate synthetase component 1